jgi:hypothetical protein
MIIAVVYITINSTLIYVEGEDIINDSSTQKITDSQYINKVTDAEYDSIQKILEYISKEIKNIDEKIVTSKTLPEYGKYPAVRLNIDTPYFGIFSIINSKLKVRNGVSTVDIASGYSIRNIINKKTIKLESFEVSSIVVITRDLKIDKNMTSADAQTCIFKLLDYLGQTKSVNKFLDKQLTAMIKGYFSKEKNTEIYDINEKVKEIDENLGYCLNELSYINALTENDITEDISTLYKYKDEILSIKSNLKSVLISQTKLDEINESITKINEEIKLFRFNVNKKYLEVSNNIDLEKSVHLVNLKMNNELVYLQNYIDKSKIEIVDQSANNIATLKDGTENTTLGSSEVTAQANEKKYEEVYKVASEAILQNMRSDVDKVNVILDKITKNNALTDEQLQTVEKLDKKQTADELLRIYIGFLNKENVFLTENAKINITEIKKSTELNIKSVEDVEYIYINISDILTHISDNFESNSVISNIKTSEGIKQVIDKVILCSKNFKKQQVTNLQ